MDIIQRYGFKLRTGLQVVLYLFTVLDKGSRLQITFPERIQQIFLISGGIEFLYSMFCQYPLQVKSVIFMVLINYKIPPAVTVFKIQLQPCLPQ